MKKTAYLSDEQRTAIIKSRDLLYDEVQDLASFLRDMKFQRIELLSVNHGLINSGFHSLTQAYLILNDEMIRVEKEMKK